MNGNNSWQQRANQFASFPKYDLGPIAQRQALPSRELVPVGQLMEGGRVPFQEAMPARQQDYGESRDQPTGKKIMGMPKDRFIALMGSIAQAFGGDSASGRMGANLISMADIMHGERMAQGERQAAEAETRREAAAELAKEKRGVATTIAKEKRGVTATIAKEGRGTAATIAKEKRKTAAMVAKEKRAAEREILSAWEATYKEMKGKINPDTKAPYTIGEIHTAFKKTGAKKPAIPKGQAGFEQIDGVWHKGYQHFNPKTKEYDFIPTREATEAEKAKTKVTPPAGEKPKEKSWAEKRARAKAAKESEAIILNPEYQNAEYQDELQMEIDNFDRYSDKPYMYHMTPGRVVDWGRDVPPKVEKIDISTPEKIMESNLPDDRKRHLLLSRFPEKFE